MKIENIKTWFTAQELADLRLPGLPNAKRKINERAAAERWALMTDDQIGPLARPRAGRGGGLEYHFSVLPIAARTALMKLLDSEAGEDRSSDHAAAWSAYDRLSAAAKAEAERRAAVIAKVEMFESAGLKRANAVVAAAAASNIGKSSLWEWLGKVDGVPASDRLPYLAPRRTGGGREAEIDADIWSFIKSDYLRPEKPTLTSCYERAKLYATAKALPIPSYRTILRKVEREIDGRLLIAKREGMDAIRSTIPATRRSVSHLHALEAVNIDGHKFDVFVRQPDGTIIRPILVGIQDVFSRKILAWRVGDVESAILTRLAFADLFRKFGIPKACYLDNGRAFASKWITGGTKNRFRFKVREDEPTGLLTSLGINIHWTKPYRGQSKPIERAWRDLADVVSKHPALAGAYTGNKPDAKPENYGSHAVPMADFLLVLEQGIRAHNARDKRRTETANGRSFDQVFDESYQIAPIAKASAEQLRLALLTGEQVSTDRKNGSIKLAGNSYWAPELSALAGKKVIIRFDPDSLHQPLHVYSHTGQYVCEAPVLEATGFDNAAAAKARGRQESELRKSVRRSAELEQLLSADQLAAMLPSYDEVDVPEPTIIRPVRHRGQTAAALKPLSTPAEAPVETPFIDPFTSAIGRLRLVE